MKPIYKVTVRVVREEETLSDSEYVKMGDAKEEGGDAVYGYPEQVMQIKQVDRILYEQTVDELDVPSLIAQVNTPPPILVDTTRLDK